MKLKSIKSLIEVIRNYPEIYAVNHSEYRNVYKKAMAWKKVKEKTGLDVKTLKIKWKSLRDTYRKYKLFHIMGNKANNNLYNWVWANEMSFIEPYIKFKPIDNASNISVDTSDFEEDDTEEENDQNETENNQSPEPETVTRVKRPVKRRHNSDSDLAVNIMTNINTEINSETDVEVPCDRTDMEFLGYANTMKKLSLRSQALIKLQITKILTQFQLEELSRTIATCNEDTSYMTTVQLTDLEPHFIDNEQKHTPDTQT